MGKIITVAGHKGGIGKSTQLISIAVCIALKGKSVCFLECDKQGSIKDFYDTRTENSILPEIPYFQCFTDIVSQAKKLAGKFDFVCLDTPGSQSPEFMKALACADFMITLIKPGSDIEINTLGKLVYDVKTAQAALNKTLKAYIVLNKCDTSPTDMEASDLRKMLNDDPDWLPVPRQRIYSRKAHEKAYNRGMGVHEFNDKNGNKARGEIELLLKEIELI